MSGKGHAPRPYSVKADVYANNYCQTFGHRPRGDGQCKHCGAKSEDSPNNLEADNGNGEPDAEGRGQAERVS